MGRASTRPRRTVRPQAVRHTNGRGGRASVGSNGDQDWGGGVGGVSGADRWGAGTEKPGTAGPRSRVSASVRIRAVVAESYTWIVRNIGNTTTTVVTPTAKYSRRFSSTSAIKSVGLTTSTTSAGTASMAGGSSPGGGGQDAGTRAAGT